MLGNLNLGVTPLGVDGRQKTELNSARIFIIVHQPTYMQGYKMEVNSRNIEIKAFSEVSIKLDIHITPIRPDINIDSGSPIDLQITHKIIPNCPKIIFNANRPQLLLDKSNANIDEYISYITQNVRTPIWKLELLRKTDETVKKTIQGRITSNSGNITVTLDEGVRRTCNFVLGNWDGEYNDFLDSIVIGDKFRLYLGYNINGGDIYFPQGVFVFDDPSAISNIAERNLTIEGTDKWSMLNGQNGGILNGTYTIKQGTTIGDLIRRTIQLDIVGDPVEPVIDTFLENQKITYDITKEAGETVSDILLEVALNVSAYIFYDVNGRLNIYPVESDRFKAPAHKFTVDEYNYLGGTKSYQLSQIYNSVLVIGENIKNSETPIIYEAVNNDLTDPNSVPNVGFKKVKKITEYTKGIDTEEKAKERGNWELKKARAKYSSVEISCLALYHLDVNQIIELTDPYLNSESERFLIQDINFTIGTEIVSTMSVTKAIEIE